MPTGHRGRPRSTTWIGKLGSWVSEFTAERLAGELKMDASSVYRYVRGDYALPVRKAIAIREIARSAGTNLSLEDLYEADILKVRRRMREPHPRMKAPAMEAKLMTRAARAEAIEKIRRVWPDTARIFIESRRHPPHDSLTSRECF
jgi:hypothetical protein